MPITAEQQIAALGNLYPDAAEHVAKHWTPGRLEARSARLHSSQALCVSVFETIGRRPPAKRDALFGALLDEAGLTPDVIEGSSVDTEVRQHGELLGEVGGGTPTALDGLLTWPAGVVTIESKFTEPGFEGCGQARPSRPNPKDPRYDPERPKRTFVNCSGDHAVGSDLKPATAHLGAPCRLTVPDGRRRPRRYWDVADKLLAAENVAVPRKPCPFAGSSYQLMRNIVFAHEWAARHELPYHGFLVTIVDAAPHSVTLRDQIAAFRNLLLAPTATRVGVLSYERIADLLDEHGDAGLASWVRNRIASVVKTPDVGRPPQGALTHPAP